MWRVLGTVKGEAKPGQNINVVFTSIESTLSALKAAGVLANRLNATISLIVPQVVPNSLPSSSTPATPGIRDRHFLTISDRSPVETQVKMYPCRDRESMLKEILKPHSVVVIGSRRSWWSTPETRLARKLRGAGHDVVVAESKGVHARRRVLLCDPYVPASGTAP